jgi:hypothetical protein
MYGGPASLVENDCLLETSSCRSPQYELYDIGEDVGGGAFIPSLGSLSAHGESCRTEVCSGSLKARPRLARVITGACTPEELVELFYGRSGVYSIL